MKQNFIMERELLLKKILRIPVISNCEVREITADGFQIDLEFTDKKHVLICVHVMKNAYPKQVKKITDEFQGTDKGCSLAIVAPYISDETGKLCRENHLGYFDFSGNCFLCLHSLYISENGNPNRNAVKYKAGNIFRTSSEVSSLILRELFLDLKRPRKLKHLADSVGCSIGQVSKVKDYLCEQLWAEMTLDGLQIIKPKEVLHAWSAQYVIPTASIHPCYTLDTIPLFEGHLKKLQSENDIEYYLTGFSGGVRYAPVVRYNRVHLLLPLEDYSDFLFFSGCKEVDSGANVLVHTVTQKDFFKDARIVNGIQIASPVQVYLDCMQLKGRGEEMAQAIYEKEINK